MNIARALQIWGTFLLISLFISCNKEDPDPIPRPGDSVSNKIMPLGASRVEGNRPNYESFRYELWKDLTQNDWTFDFIGTQSDPANYPEFLNAQFDTDHEGRGGWTSGQILAGLPNWLSQTGAPDIVLFSSPGGNDALQGRPFNQAVININAIVDTLQAANPNMTIIIEQMAPALSSLATPALVSYFNQMQQEVARIATDKSTNSSQVIAVDMYTGFSDSLLADPVHYNAAGADFIAERYYNVLINVLDSE